MNGSIYHMINFIQKFRNFQLPFLTTVEVYFDLGTTTTKIAVADKGIVLREPTYLGYNSKTKDYIFFGNEAKSILGKTPEFIKIVRPIVNGVISDFDAEVALLKTFLRQSVDIFFVNQLIKPSLSAVAAVPSVATEIEQKAVQETMQKLGLSPTHLIEKTVATATGSGINVFSHHPNLIVDLGGGLIELAIVGSGGIIVQKTLKNAGGYMNKLIYNYVYLKYGIILGESTCETLKINLLNFEGAEKTITIRGKSLESGLPKSVRIKTADIKEALITNFNQIADSIHELVETSPPEILDELLQKGIILTGGLAQIKGLDKFFANELKLDVYCAENAADTTINGLIKIARNFDQMLKLSIDI